MALPFYPTFRNLFLTATTTSTGGQEVKVCIPVRCKYVNTLLSVYGTTCGGTSNFDLFAYLNTLGQASTVATTIVSLSTGVSITTSSGNVTYELFGSTTTPAIYFNKGDILGCSGSTGITGVTGYTVTHILQEL